MKSWMIICSSLERHSLSLLIRVTVKASQFMDSSRLGQYTNSSSAYRHQRKKKNFFCRAVNHLFFNFLTNFLCLQFPIIPRSSFKFGSYNYWYTHMASCWGQWLLYFIVKHNHYFLAPLIYVTLTTKKAPSVGDV